MSARHITRRNLLATLAVGAGGIAAFDAPLRRWLIPNADAAPASTLPLARVVFMAFSHGLPDDSNGRTDFSVYGGSPTNYTLGMLTAPLMPLMNEMTIVDSLSMYVPHIGDDTHLLGTVQLLTGLYPPQFANGVSSNISIDQYLGQKVGTVVTPGLPNLVLGVQSDGLTYSYADDGSPVTGIDDPYAVYSKLFSSLQSGSTGPSAAMLDRLARRKSVLDSVTQDLAAFRRRLSTEDKARADAQLSAIQTLEQRLMGGMQQGPTCTPPTLTQGLDPENDAAFLDLFGTQIDNIVAAFACDLTRIVVLEPRPQFNTKPCEFNPVNASQTQHSLSHDINDEVPNGRQPFRTMKQPQFAMAAQLAQKLKSIPEGAARCSTARSSSSAVRSVMGIPTPASRSCPSAAARWASILASTSTYGKGEDPSDNSAGTTGDDGFGVRSRRAFPHEAMGFDPQRVRLARPDVRGHHGRIRQHRTDRIRAAPWVPQVAATLMAPRCGCADRVRAPCQRGSTRT